jgi:hypothetical protein
MLPAKILVQKCCENERPEKGIRSMYFTYNTGTAVLSGVPSLSNSLMEAAGVKEFLVAGRVVALVENQSNRLAIPGQHLRALGQFFQCIVKAHAVMLIVRIDLPQQGDVKVDAHQPVQTFL